MIFIFLRLPDRIRTLPKIMEKFAFWRGGTQKANFNNFRKEPQYTRTMPIGQITFKMQYWLLFFDSNKLQWIEESGKKQMIIEVYTN